jgi:crotonobetainyl-CoA:carnitine CoA-transferase CaiB-like acyl-CoA transferase
MLCDRMKVETENRKPVSAFFKSTETKNKKRVSIKKKRKSQEREIIKKQIYRKTKFRRRDQWLRKYRKRS